MCLRSGARWLTSGLTRPSDWLQPEVKSHPPDSLASLRLQALPTRFLGCTQHLQAPPTKSSSPTYCGQASPSMHLGSTHCLQDLPIKSQVPPTCLCGLAEFKPHSSSFPAPPTALPKLSFLSPHHSHHHLERLLGGEGLEGTEFSSGSSLPWLEDNSPMPTITKAATPLRMPKYWMPKTTW